MKRILIALSLLAVLPAAAQTTTCALEFTVEVTQGVGMIRPGTELAGRAEFTRLGQSFRQDGGTTAHMATGEMALGDGISGPIWTLIATSRAHATELIGVHAHHVEGLTVAGVPFSGPMILTLFGPPGSRPDATPPNTQEEWDQMNLRRAFSLHASGADMLAGDVTALTAACS